MAADDPITRSDFYVYVLFRENGVPFYVGKGQVGIDGNIMRKPPEVKPKDIDSRLSVVCTRAASRVPKIKVHEGLTEVRAHEYEVAIIKAIGRGSDGPLVNPHKMEVTGCLRP